MSPERGHGTTWTGTDECLHLFTVECEQEWEQGHQPAAAVNKEKEETHVNNTEETSHSPIAAISVKHSRMSAIKVMPLNAKSTVSVEDQHQACKQEDKLALDVHKAEDHKVLCTGSLLDAVDLHQVADMVVDPNTGVHASQEISVINKKRRSLRNLKTRREGNAVDC